VGRAVEAALHADARETAAIWQVNGALQEGEVGNQASAKEKASAALNMASHKDVKTAAALAFARAGEIGRAEKLAGELEKQFAEDTLLAHYWIPSIRAAIELSRNNPKRALELLQASSPYELASPLPGTILWSLYPIYLRGEAYLKTSRPDLALQEFQKLLDHRGILGTCPIGSLAHLQIGRAYALQKDVVRARNSYQEFLNQWKEADADVPLLLQAKSEFSKLAP